MTTSADGMPDPVGKGSTTEIIGDCPSAI